MHHGYSNVYRGLFQNGILSDHTNLTILQRSVSPFRTYKDLLYYNETSNILQQAATPCIGYAPNVRIAFNKVNFDNYFYMRTCHVCPILCPRSITTHSRSFCFTSPLTSTLPQLQRFKSLPLQVPLLHQLLTPTLRHLPSIPHLHRQPPLIPFRKFLRPFPHLEHLHRIHPRFLIRESLFLDFLLLALGFYGSFDGSASLTFLAGEAKGTGYRAREGREGRSAVFEIKA